MLRFVVALLLLSAPSWAAGPEDSIVRVIVKEHDKVLSTKSGVVIPGGFVVTTFNNFDKITNVEIVIAGRDPSQARGVVAYNFPDNLMVMRIDWDGAIPPAATLADAAPAKDSALSLIVFGRGTEEFKLSVDAGLARFAFGGPRNDPSLGGAAVFHKGRLAGVVTGAHIVAGAAPNADDQGLPSGILAARVELIKALDPGETILWSKWNKRVDAIRRADKIYQQGLKDLNPQKIPAALEELGARLKNVVDLDPFHRGAWSDLAMFHFQGKRFEEALVASSHANALCPTNHQVLRVRATILGAKGQWSDAIAAASSAVRLRPDVAENHATLGAAYVGDRRYDDAVAEYKEAVRLDPNSTEAAQGLKIAEEWRAKGK